MFRRKKLPGSVSVCVAVLTPTLLAAQRPVPKELSLPLLRPQGKGDPAALEARPAAPVQVRTTQRLYFPLCGHELRFFKKW